MSRSIRRTALALAAIASLGLFALTTHDASARGFGGHGGMRMGGGMHVGIAHTGSFRTIGHRPTFIVNHRPHFHWRYGWRRPYWVAPVVATGVATGVVSAPTWNRCTCLTKEYTPEGAVVFKDLCTKEMAMNPPANVSPAAYDPSQDPTTQGGLQPQIQQAQPVLPQVR
jgi:hypothetical protein